MPAPARVSESALAHRIMVDEIAVTAVGDGYLPIDPKMLPASDPDTVGVLMEEACLPPGPIRTYINAFVVDTPARRILIDAGLGAGPAETVGRLPASLAAAGIAPETIDLVLLTHLHRDHVRGLSAAGVAFYPNAEVLLHAADLAYWTDAAEEEKAPAFAKQHFGIARAALAPYGGRVGSFAASGEVAAGIAAIHAPGHTPGHTMYRIASADASLLIAADIVHLPALQFPRPDWSIMLDVDPTMAATTRCRVLDAAAAGRQLLTGMHFSFPGFGYVRKHGSGYRFVPALWPA